MPDIAYLGLAIQTDQLVDAHKKLGDVSTAAGAAEQSTKKLTDATKALGETADKAAASARRMTQYDDAATALYRSAQAAADAAVAYKRAAAGFTDMASSSAATSATKKISDEVTRLSTLTAHQRLMLGYQLNDIFTQLVSGQSPFMIAAQQ